MYKIGDYLVYRRDVCKVMDIKKNHLSNKDYYILIPINDNSLKLEIPVDNRCGYIRNIISKEEVKTIINNIPIIEIIENEDKLIENEYRELINSAKHEDLIKIIKTTYIRNKDRLDSKKKISEKDDKYFNLAEQYLYMSFLLL